MLKKYFADYTGSEAELYKNFGQNDGDIKSLKSNFFAGIKVYPLLGFDPWPEKNKEQMERVIYLYDYCQRKGIPITTHCSDNGYRVIDPELALENCNPLKWEKVLKEFPKLKLNLAHFGKRKKIFKSVLKCQRNLWLENVLRLIKNHENVYADFADIGVKDSFYKSLKELIDKQDEKDKLKLKEHILFGSDFFINLQSIDSYNVYLKKYSQCVLHDVDKDKFCRINPQRFLFKPK
jgi:predicted TIM-barrel fold metal-dependent hydrolase